MDENTVVDFFNAVLDDNIDKLIIQLISNDLDTDEIIEELIKHKNEAITHD